MRSVLQAGEHCLRKFRVRVDALDIVELFQPIKKPENLLALLIAQIDSHLGYHRQLGSSNWKLLFGKRSANGFELARCGNDFDDPVFAPDVFRPCVDGRELDLLGLTAPRVHRNHSLALELPRDRPGFSKIATGTGEGRTELGRGPLRLSVRTSTIMAVPPGP